MRDIAIGLDLATASARCVALDATSGAVLATVTARLPDPARDGSGSSTQEAAYTSVATELLARVCAELGPRARSVGALSVTGTSGTVVPCDGAGTPVGLARLYDDTSGSEYARRRGVAAGSMLARVASLVRDHEDAVCFATSPDVVANALVGKRVSGDSSHWLKAGIDPVGCSWPAADLSALDLERQTLPPLVHPGTVLGEVKAQVASRIGLPPAAQVVAGMTDGCTAQIATGAVRVGDTVGVLGTTLVLKAVSEVAVSSPDGAVYSHLAPDGLWWAGGASNSGAGVLGAEFAHTDLAAMDEAVAGTWSSVVRYPLAVVGERFPVADPELTSLVSADPRSQQDAYRAVLDGVAFVERLGLERLAALGAPTQRHVLAGGASASAVWNRIRATVLADVVPVQATSRAGSAIGAAILAAARLPQETDSFAAVVDRLASSAQAVEPVAAQRSPLDESYRRFLDLLSAATSTSFVGVTRRA